MENCSVDSLTSRVYNTLSVFKTPPGDPQFVNEIEHVNKCKQCKNVLRDPVQLMCGHMVCSDPCLETTFAGHLEKICQYENCGMLIQREQVFPDAFKSREIQRLPVHCTNKNDGCLVKIPWKDLKDHEDRCDFRKIPCPLSSDGCAELVPHKDLEHHQMNTCLYTTVLCCYCHQQMRKLQYQEHIDEICPSILLNCPYSCGLKQVTRDQYNAHITHCEHKPQACSFSCVGCDYVGKRREVADHEASKMVHHIDLIKTYTKSIEEKNQAMLNEILTLKNERESLMSYIWELQRQNGEFQSEVTKSKQTIKELKKQIASQTEKLIHIERKVEDKADKDIEERNLRSLNVLKETLQQLSTRMSAIEREGPGSNNGGISGQLATLIRNIDQQCSLHDVRLAELDLRFQILETANYDGVLMWKIKDFKRRFKEAKEGKTLSLFSQPFYTNKHGYRMCGRLYLNGDGIGKGKFLSFFFVIMRGDYDNLLSWPFRHTVSLMLLDQDRRVQNIRDTFTPDPNSNSFQKPRSEMNVASGVPCFIEHSKLLNEPTYLQDDTVYLKIAVDTTVAG